VISIAPLVQDVTNGSLHFPFTLEIDVDNESDPARSVMTILRTCANTNCLK
jgi:hypothetical protein